MSSTVFEESPNKLGILRRFPARQLNSSRIRNSLRVNLMPLVSRSLETSWLLVLHCLGSPAKDFDDTVFFKKFPKAIQKASEIRDKVGYRHVPLDENDFSDPIRRARKQFIDARVSNLARKSLHTRCIEPVEANGDSTNGKDQEAPPEKEEEASEEGTSKKRFRFQ